MLMVQMYWYGCRYGTVRGSDIEAFFGSSVIFSRIWATMTRPEGNEVDKIYTPLQTVTSDMVNECAEGIARVRSGESPNYVFLWHSPGIR